MNEGKIPSVREICSRTGGSMTTISMHRREWAAGLAAAVFGTQAAGVPEEVSEAFNHLWQAALTSAQRQFDSARDDLSADAEGVQRRVTAAQYETERASVRSTELEQELAAARAEIALLNDKLARRAKEHDLIVSSLNALVEELTGQIAKLADDHAAKVNQMTADHQRLNEQRGAQLREIERLSGDSAAPKSI